MSVGNVAQLGQSLLSSPDGGAAGKGAPDNSAFAAMMAGAADAPSDAAPVTVASLSMSSATGPLSIQRDASADTAAPPAGAATAALDPTTGASGDDIGPSSTSASSVAANAVPSTPSLLGSTGRGHAHGMRVHGKHASDATDDTDPTAVMPAIAPTPVASDIAAIDDDDDGVASALPATTGTIALSSSPTDPSSTANASATDTAPKLVLPDPSLAPVLAALADSAAAAAGSGSTSAAPDSVSALSILPAAAADPRTVQPPALAFQPSTAALMAARQNTALASSAAFAPVMASPTPAPADSEATASAARSIPISPTTLPPPAGPVENPVIAPVAVRSPDGAAVSAAAMASSQASAQTAPRAASARLDPRNASRKAVNDADPDASSTDTAAPDASSVPVGLTPIAVHPSANVATATAPADPATGQLAAGGTDRQIDLAKQGAWLDGLSRDIAATGDASSPLRFGVAPQHLGSVQVEMLRDSAGASSVTLTASSDAARTALADARPQLVADARAQGIHIASAQVDVGTQSNDSRGSSQGQGESRPSSNTNSNGSPNFSGQSNAQADSGRQSQTRSQPLAANPVRLNRTTDAATDAESAPPADGLYA